MEEERLLILQMLSDKKITPQEAVELLKALEGTVADAETAVGAQTPPDQPPDAPADSDDPSPAGSPPPPPRPAQPSSRVPRGGLSALTEMIAGLVNRLPHLTPGIEVTEEREGLLDPAGGSAATDGHAGEPAGDPLALDLQTTNGRLVMHGWDQPGYRVRITRQVRAGSEEEARRRGSELAVFSVQPGRVSLQVAENTDLTLCSLELWVPADRRYRLDARTHNGRIEVEGLSGATARLRTGNGRIRLTGGSWQEAECKTGNGSVEARIGTGRLEASTGNGSVTVALQGCRSAEISAHTGNGSVTVDTRETAGAAIRVDASTGMGSIRNRLANLAIIKQREHMTSHRLEAQSAHYEENPDKVIIRARTGVGSITIE